MNVLLVDDDQADAELITRILEKFQPNTIMQAQTCDQAVQTLKTWSTVECVIIDQQLIGMSGVECIPTIREAAPQAALVMLTGLPDERIAVQAIRNGADDFLSKNRMWEALVPAIEDAIRRRAEIVAILAKASSRQQNLQQLFQELQDLTGKVHKLIEDRGERES